MAASVCIWDNAFKGKPRNNFVSKCYVAAKKLATQNGLGNVTVNSMAKYAYSVGGPIWEKKH